VTSEGERRDRRLELAATVLLAVAAVTTAWCSYQATRWSSEQTKESGTTNRLRLEAGRAQGLAEAQTQVDLATYIQWVDAYALKRTTLQEFYVMRFREEFKPAFEAWLATRPLTNPNAPLSPFAMPQYRLAATAEYERLDEEAAASSELRDVYIQRQSNYVLAVVLMAVALFLAGMSTKLGRRMPRTVLLACGYVVFLSTIVWIATFPVNVAI
jgi:hypothetical protein